MMKMLNGAILAATASATTLKLTWTDCGTHPHAKITGFTPDTLKTGQETTMTGTGNLDEDVSSANFDLEMKTAVKTISCKGDASQSKTCPLPLGTGSLTFEPMSFPLKKGSIPVSVSIKLSALLPGMLAKTDTTVKSTGPNGEELFCMNIKTTPALEANVPLLAGVGASRKCGPMLPNTAATKEIDTPGVDIATMGAQDSWEDCRSLCQATAGCTAWSQTTDWSQNQCWIKRSPALSGYTEAFMQSGACWDEEDIQV